MGNKNVILYKVLLKKEAHRFRAANRVLCNNVCNYNKHILLRAYVYNLSLSCEKDRFINDDVKCSY